MYVIADIEWAADVNGRCRLTQLAAVRVDSEWNVFERFCAVVSSDDEGRGSSRIAFTGGRAERFSERSARASFCDFLSWISDEDILLFWRNDSVNVYKRLFSENLKKNDTHRSICLEERIYSFLKLDRSSVCDPYKIAESRGVDVGLSSDYSSQTDVKVLQGLLKSVNFPHKLLFTKVGADGIKQPFPYMYESA